MFDRCPVPPHGDFADIVNLILHFHKIKLVSGLFIKNFDTWSAEARTLFIEILSPSGERG